MTALRALPALFACLLLCAGCGSSVKEIWQPEERIQVESLGGPTWGEERALGSVTLSLHEPARVTTTPSERLYLHHEEKYFSMGWDNFGLVFFGILGSVLSVGLYFLFAFAVFDTTEDEEE